MKMNLRNNNLNSKNSQVKKWFRRFKRMIHHQVHHYSNKTPVTTSHQTISNNRHHLNFLPSKWTPKCNLNLCSSTTTWLWPIWTKCSKWSSWRTKQYPIWLRECRSWRTWPISWRRIRGFQVILKSSRLCWRRMN